MNDDGGPAFPEQMVYDPIKERMVSTTEELMDPGMTLRDWFAGQALVGLTPKFRLIPTCKEGIEERKKCVKESYLLADLMLAERKKGTHD